MIRAASVYASTAPGLPQRHQQVPAAGQQDRQVLRTGVLAHAVDEGQGVAVGPQGPGDLHRLRRRTAPRARRGPAAR